MGYGFLNGAVHFSICSICAFLLQPGVTMNVLQQQRQLAKSIQEQISRAKGYLRRGDIIKSIDAACSAYTMIKSAKLMGKDKIETHYALEEFCIEFSAHSGVQDFLESINVKVKPIVSFVPGKENIIIERMTLIKKGLVKIEEAQESKIQEKREARKKHLFGTGRDLFESKNYPKGRSFLRKAAEDYPDDSEMLMDIAKLFMKHNFPGDAYEVLAQIIEDFPNVAAAYSLATKALLIEERYEETEQLYLAAMKQFGKHPNTLLNMSRMYLQWNKKDKAFERAKEALDADPSLEEAREIVEKTI